MSELQTDSLTGWQVVRATYALSSMSRRQVTVTAGLFIGAAISSLVTGYGLKWLTNVLMVHGSPWWPASLIIASLFVNWLFFRFGFERQIRLQAPQLKRVNDRAFELMGKKNHTFFQDEFVGRIVKRIGAMPRAFEIIDDVLTRDVPHNLATFVGAIIVIGISQPFTAWLLTLAYLSTAYGLYRATLWKAQFDQIKSKAESKLSGSVSDAVSNQHAIRLFDGQQHELALIEQETQDVCDKRFKSWMIGDRIWAVQGLLTFALTALTLLWCLFRWQQNRLTAGDVLMTYGYVGMLANQLNQIRQMTRQLFEAIEEGRDSLLLLNDPRIVHDHPKAKEYQRREGEIVFRDVGFSYGQEGGDLLRDFTLKIMGGQKIALCGPSGAGKTTVLKLLMRLHELDCGEIFLDGQPLSKLTQSSLRRAIVQVPQEAMLFHRSLLENIRYGRRDATDEEVKQAARLAHCEEFILRLPKQYDTLVGERGVKLSGGERQRIAIARAFLSRAPIVLLDEATSQLDSESEALVQGALRELMQQRTMIVIAHRLSTIKMMDRIIVMDGGRIVDEGKHDDLIRKKGLYARLWNIQAGDYAFTAPSACLPS